MIRRYYDLHGVRIDVAAEDGAAEVIPALDRRLSHYAIAGDGAAPALRCVYGGDGPALPRGPARDVYDTPTGTVRYHPEADVVSAKFGELRLRVDRSGGGASIGGAVLAGERAYLGAHTLTTIALMELLKRQGLFALHSACLAQGGHGVVIAGTSGAGKSTLALALALTGLEYLSDDLVFLRPATPAGGVRVLGFADAVGIGPGTLRLLPRLTAICAAGPDPGFPKYLMPADVFASGRIASDAEPRVVVFPEIANADHSHIEPLDPREAWVRLVPDILLTDPATTGEHLAAIAQLTEQVRCYRLRTGRDLAGAARKVAALL